MCRCLQIASVYRVFPVGFGGMILAAQLLNALFAVLGATLLWELLRPFLPRMAVLPSIAVSAYGPFLLETANGMEMSALSAAALAMLWLIKQPQPRTTVPPTRWNSLEVAATSPTRFSLVRAYRPHPLRDQRRLLRARPKPPTAPPCPKGRSTTATVRYPGEPRIPLQSNLIQRQVRKAGSEPPRGPTARPPHGRGPRCVAASPSRHGPRQARALARVAW